MCPSGHQLNLRLWGCRALGYALPWEPKGKIICICILVHLLTCLCVCIGEMTLVQARVEMYWRFVRKRCLADMEVAQVGGATAQERRALLDTMVAGSQLNRWGVWCIAWLRGHGADNKWFVGIISFDR